MATKLELAEQCFSRMVEYNNLLMANRTEERSYHRTEEQVVERKGEFMRSHESATFASLRDELESANHNIADLHNKIQLRAEKLAWLNTEEGKLATQNYESIVSDIKQEISSTRTCVNQALSDLLGSDWRVNFDGSGSSSIGIIDPEREDTATPSQSFEDYYARFYFAGSFDVYVRLETLAGEKINKVEFSVGSAGSFDALDKNNLRVRLYLGMAKLIENPQVSEILLESVTRISSIRKQLRLIDSEIAVPSIY